MEPVDVLGDDGIEQAAPLELDERRVRRVRLLVGEVVKTRAVEVPEALRVAVEGIDGGDRHRIDLGPESRAGRAKVRDAGGNRDPRAGERDHAPARLDQFGELGGGRLLRFGYPERVHGM